MNLVKSYSKYLIELQNISRYRKLTLRRGTIERSFIDFSSNDYLSLSNHPEVIKAAVMAAEQFGVGSTGSRLLSGNHQIFMDLESKIAADKKTAAALIFNSGFQANFSVLLALLNAKILGSTPLVFFDKLNHASLYQAVFASAAQLIRYNHNDMNHLAKLLFKYQNYNQPKFIVTETLFGMDGDVIDLESIAALAYKYRAFLYLDEAHAIGIFGDKGYGLSTTLDLAHLEYLAMGTFSKALGSSGGYIACSEMIKDYIVNTASGFIYSTANPLPVLLAASKAWELIALMQNERQALHAKSIYLRKNLTDLGFDIGNSSSHIIPMILKSENLAIKAKEHLLKNHLVVSCIRPPTVPPGSARLRLALNANHKDEHIEQLLVAVKLL